MKIGIIGIGGAGGMLAFTLAKAGFPVEFEVHGAHGQAALEHGLTVKRAWNGETETVSLQPMTSKDLDLILVCVKQYSLESAVPVILEHTEPGAVVLPILNGFGAGDSLRPLLPGRTVLDGLIYVSANIESPGVLYQHTPILRVVYGRADGVMDDKVMGIAAALRDSGIELVPSDRIMVEVLEKFSYVSPAGVAGLVCGVTAGGLQKEGAARDYFISLIREVDALGTAMGYPNPKDLVAKNCGILDGLLPETTTSLQRDVLSGRPAETDALIDSVIRMGNEYGVPTPAYERAAEWLRSVKK